MIRQATNDDLVDLFELEKQASTVALAHVFGPDTTFPDDDVLARWRLVLDEPGLAVLIDVDGEGAGDHGRAVGYAAFGDGWLRHFGVHPAWWGTGRADALHARAVAGMAAQGASSTSLWVLVDNHRARAFYRRHGWEDSAVRDYEVFRPFPAKMQMVRRQRRPGIP